MINPPRLNLIFNVFPTPLFGLVATAALLSGCAFNTPVPALETSDIPQYWVSTNGASNGENLEGDGGEGSGSGLQSGIETINWPESDWWITFNDQELSQIIALVQENNLDLENNERNLQSAQITLRDAGFNLLPTPSVQFGTGARYTETDIAGVSSSGSPNVPYDLSASLSYNNILSKPANYERAQANYDSSVAQHANTILNTLGTTASTYFQLLFTRDQIEAALQNVENAESIADITNARVEAGVAVPIDALQQQIQIETQRNNLRSLVQRDLSARSSLALLQGRSVQDYEVTGATLQNIAVPTVEPGLPSELLRRRPDLVQAEASLRSAATNVDLVYLDLFPQISLTGSFNASSTSLSQLVSSPDTALNISANLVQTLLDNGQRYRNLEQARLNLENALNNYRKAVIGAFNEIEVLLSNIQLLEVQTEVALENLNAAEESFRIAEIRYEEGVADFQTVLTNQNSLFSTRNSYLNAKLQQLNAMVSLYQALGGGWQADAAE